MVWAPRRVSSSVAVFPRAVGLWGAGFGCGEGTNAFGVFCLLVTSSAIEFSASSHSARVMGNARCFCVFDGGAAEVGVGFRTADVGELGVGSSHSS